MRLSKKALITTLWLFGIALCGNSCEDETQEDETCVDGMCSGNENVLPEENAPCLSITPDAFIVSEAMQSARLTIKALCQPQEDVSVQLSIMENNDEITLDKTQITFTNAQWNEPVYVTVSGVDDGLRDGDQNIVINVTVNSQDEAFTKLGQLSISGKCVDDGKINPQEGEGENSELPDDSDDYSDVPADKRVRLRLMAANLTSGKNQEYQNEGIRIFQALQPDIVMIQEFKYGGGQQGLVNKAFGGFYWASTTPDDANSPLPNGIISRYEILESGSWRGDHTASNRNYDWALIDLPGSIDLLAVSVHLLTDKSKHRAEMPELVSFIKNKLNDLRLKNPSVTYAAVVGGDFNVSEQEGRGYAESQFSSIFKVKNGDNEAYPVDQNGNDLTSGERDDPYDWVLVTPNFDVCETPVVIGKHTYPNGHVFDSRVYGNYTKKDVQWGCITHHYVDELSDLPSVVKMEDSNATNMQHMAVIRDFIYTTLEPQSADDKRCHFH